MNPFCFLFKSSVIFMMMVYVTNGYHNPPPLDEREKDRAHWVRIGQEELSRALNKQPINKRAKNIILFMGDGMGVTTVTGTRIINGQFRRRTGEEGLLFFEGFPNVALSKTYSVDKQTSDSSSTATAMFSGVKTNFKSVGVDPMVKKGNCSSQIGRELTTILNWSLQAGKHVGFVTNTRVTHATPASLYAHSADRNWENDADMKGVEGAGVLCKDIARQLVEDNPDIHVIMGGGRRNFLPETAIDPETKTRNVNKRQDGRDLIQKWLQDKRARGKNASYVWTSNALHQLDFRQTEYILGLFDSSHMEYEYARTYSPDPVRKEAGEPSLAEMTDRAIATLEKSEKGYFLFVEGGRIDHAHHNCNAKLALAEGVVFDYAVERAVIRASPEDTLIIVTADHSHVLTIGGYASRGNSISGRVNDPLVLDNMPYTSMLYGNGPGYKIVNGSRENITDVDVEDINYKQQAGVPVTFETHGGEDVAIYAKGPMGHLFHATHEQSYIAYVMAYASCVGRYSNLSNCAASLETHKSAPDSGSTIGPSLMLDCIVLGFVLWVLWL